MPKDTDLILSLNVRQVLDSPAVKANALDLFRTTLNNSPDLQEAIKALGLDPLTDFSRVSVGVSLENINRPRAIAVIEGKFDVDKIAKLMDELVKKDSKRYGIEKSGGKTLYRLSLAADSPAVYSSLIDARILVLATVKEITANAARGERKSELRKELTALLSKADPKASLFVVGHVKGRLNSVSLPDADLKKMLEQIETITGEVRIDKDLQAAFTLETSGADVAKRVQSLAESAISLYRLQLKLALSDQLELKPLVELAASVKAVQKDKNVIITGSLSGAAIEKLLKPEKK